MKEKIKILLSLLLVALFAVACSKKKSDNMGLLALLLLGDDSSSSSSSATTKEVNLKAGFPTTLHGVIAYTKGHDHDESLTSLAAAPAEWTRLNDPKVDASKIDMAKGDKVEFAIVPKEGKIPAESDLVVIGTYTKPDDKENVKVSSKLSDFTSASAAASNKKLDDKEMMAFMGIAKLVLDVGNDTALKSNAAKLIKETKGSLSAIMTDARTGNSNADAIVKTIAKLKSAVLTAGKGLDGLTGKADAIDTGALATAVKSAIDAGDAGTAPVTGDKPTATLTIAENQNATTSVNTALGIGTNKAFNGSQTIKIVVDSTNLGNSPTYFLYTATEEGTRSITPLTVSNITKSTPVKLSAKNIDGYINYTSSYVYTLAACKSSVTRAADINDTDCAYSTTEKVNWKPTVVLRDKTVIKEASAKFTARNKKDGSGLDSVKLNLASVLANQIGDRGWTLGLKKGASGYWSRGTVGIADPANITVSQALPSGKTLQTAVGTLSIGATSLLTPPGSGQVSSVAVSSEVLIKNYYVPQAGLGANAMSNVSGTVRVTACSAYAPPAGCVSVDVEIDGGTAY